MTKKKKKVEGKIKTINRYGFATVVCNDNGRTFSIDVDISTYEKKKKNCILEAGMMVSVHCIIVNGRIKPIGVVETILDVIEASNRKAPYIGDFLENEQDEVWRAHNANTCIY